MPVIEEDQLAPLTESRFLEDKMKSPGASYGELALKVFIHSSVLVVQVMYYKLSIFPSPAST